VARNAKDNWGEKSVSDENERTPEAESKSTNRRHDEKAAQVVLPPQFLQGAENGNFGHI